MDNPVYILVYSKYSSYCKRLLTTIQHSPVDFSYLQPLCVDNPEVRARVKNDEKLQILAVPSILVCYSDGVVERFDGENAFDWVGEVVRKYTPPAPPPPPPEPEPEPPKNLPPPQEPDPLQVESFEASPEGRYSSASKRTPIESLEDSRPEEMVKPSAIDLKAKNLQVSAEAMQKEREALFEQQNKRPFPATR